MVVPRHGYLAALTPSTGRRNRLLDSTCEGTSQDSDERLPSAQTTYILSLRSESRASTLHTQHH
jgi:hypothetical protein